MKDLSVSQMAYDQFLINVIDDTNLQYGNPSNIVKIRRDFFKNYQNPIFEYDKIPEDLQKSKALLDSMNLKNDGNSVIHRLQKSFLLEQRNRANMYLTKGTPDFTKFSKKLFGSPSSKLVSLSQEILSEKSVPKNFPKITSSTTMAKLRSGFKEIGLEGWNLKRIPMSASASVNVTKRILHLKSRERFQEPFVRRLIVHEIGTHVVRFENGNIQPLKMLAHGTAKYLSTEEGLAVYSEIKSDCSSQTQMRNYAGRVLANVYAQESDFVQTYKNLRHYFGPRESFKLTLRSKRGVEDSSHPGGLTKDHIYLKGLFEVEKFAKKNDLQDLYIGKIGIADIKLLKDLPFLEKPKFLPDFLTKKEEVLQRND